MWLTSSVLFPDLCGYQEPRPRLPAIGAPMLPQHDGLTSPETRSPNKFFLTSFSQIFCHSYEKSNSHGHIAMLRGDPCTPHTYSSSSEVMMRFFSNGDISFLSMRLSVGTNSVIAGQCFKSHILIMFIVLITVYGIFRAFT